MNGNIAFAEHCRARKKSLVASTGIDVSAKGQSTASFRALSEKFYKFSKMSYLAGNRLTAGAQPGLATQVPFPGQVFLQEKTS